MGMDSLSLSVNITTILGLTVLTIKSCDFLYHFFSNILGAPNKLQYQRVWLRALLSTLSELRKLSTE